MGAWTEQEVEFLIKHYPDNGKAWCAKKLKRSGASVRQKTARLKLRLKQGTEFWKDWQKRAAKGKVGNKHTEETKDKISKSHIGKKVSKATREKIGETSRDRIKKNGHPRGMLGKNHSKETCALFSKQRRGKKKNLSEESRQLLSDRASKMMRERIRNKGDIYSRSHNGWYEINSKPYYFRSSWEVVYGRYLEFLKLNKVDPVFDWEYEPETFWFENIKRGVRSYTPDFKVYERQRDGSVKTWFVEVKGYMDSKSKTKIKRMAKYYPEIELKVVDKEAYSGIKPMERLFPEAKEIKNPNK